MVQHLAVRRLCSVSSPASDSSSPVPSEAGPSPVAGSVGSPRIWWRAPAGAQGQRGRRIARCSVRCRCTSGLRSGGRSCMRTEPPFASCRWGLLGRSRLRCAPQFHNSTIPPGWTRWLASHRASASSTQLSVRLYPYYPTNCAINVTTVTTPSNPSPSRHLATPLLTLPPLDVHF